MAQTEGTLVIVMAQETLNIIYVKQMVGSPFGKAFCYTCNNARFLHCQLLKRLTCFYLIHPSTMCGWRLDRHLHPRRRGRNYDLVAARATLFVLLALHLDLWWLFKANTEGLLPSGLPIASGQVVVPRQAFLGAIECITARLYLEPTSAYFAEGFDERLAFASLPFLCGETLLVISFYTNSHTSKRHNNR